ncbi:hypothetical protein, partial [Helicobacter bilis]|uniref:hypothetical protein n=1 Tax=Helicobacter bilis TaxID=37372 RepID=UPI0029423BE9
LFAAFKGICVKVCGHVLHIHSLDFYLITLKINQKYFRVAFSLVMLPFSFVMLSVSETSKPYAKRFFMLTHSK